MAAVIILLILVGAGLAVYFPMHSLVYSGKFLGWVINKAENIYRVLVIAIAVILVDIIIGTWMNNSAMLGAGFVAALAIFFTIWTPAGYGLKKFGITNKVYPEFIGSAFFWLAFSGFVRMCFPRSSGGIEFTIGVLLFWVVNAGFNVALNKNNPLPMKIAMGAAILMAIGGTFRTVWPDTFSSLDKRFTAVRKYQDKKRNEVTRTIEAQAAITLRIMERKSIIYKMDGNVLKPQTQTTLKQNEIVRIVNPDSSGIVVEGETFVEIRRQNNDGSFINDEAFFVQQQKFVQGNYEVFPNAYTPECAISKNGKIWKVVSITDEPFKIENLPLGKKFFKISGGDYLYSSDGQSWDKIKPDETRKTDASVWLTLAKGQSVEIVYL